MGKPTLWFPNSSDTNRAVQSQKKVRSLKFQIKEEEELHYLYSENKGTDQLRSCYCSRFGFRICRLLVLFCCSSFYIFVII